VKTVSRNGKRIKLQIWDTAGQERYRTITTAYYRGALGFILMYDITSEESFNAVQDWSTQITTYSSDNAQVILVGNKADMAEERVVSYERGQALARQLGEFLKCLHCTIKNAKSYLGIPFYETSAKSSMGVTESFDKLVEMIFSNMGNRLQQANEGNENVNLETSDPSNPMAELQKKCGC